MATLMTLLTFIRTLTTMFLIFLIKILLNFSLYFVNFFFKNFIAAFLTFRKRLPPVLFQTFLPTFLTPPQIFLPIFLIPFQIFLKNRRFRASDNWLAWTDA